MDLSKVKVTESQKDCLIAVATSENGLSYTDRYVKAFNSLALMQMIVRGPQFTKEQQEQQVIQAWKSAASAVRAQDVKQLKDALAILDNRHYFNSSVFRLTSLGESWVSWWKAKQFGDDLTSKAEV